MAESAAFLGHYADSSSAPPNRAVLSLLQQRFMLQSSARHLLFVPGLSYRKQHRICGCLRWFIPGSSTVGCWYSPSVSRGHLKDLQTCDMLWVCPICAAKITERRRVELARGLEVSPYNNALMTFTFSHRRGQALVTIWDALMASVGSFFTHREWARICKDFGYVGHVRSQEVTWSLQNGFHPHVHAMPFWEADLSSRIDELQHRAKVLWLSTLSRFGLSGSWQHALDVRLATGDAVLDYPIKLGLEELDWSGDSNWSAAHEMAKGVSSKGARLGSFSMQQVLLDFTLHRDSFDGGGGTFTWHQRGMVWREYALASRGRRQLEWSRAAKGRPSLRDLLGLGVDKSDAEINAEVEQDSLLLMNLEYADWMLILANDARAELKAAVDTGEAENILKLLADLVPSGEVV